MSGISCAGIDLDISTIGKIAAQNTIKFAQDGLVSTRFVQVKNPAFAVESFEFKTFKLGGPPTL